MATAETGRTGRRATWIAAGALAVVAAVIFGLSYDRTDPPARDRAEPDRAVDIASEDARHRFDDLGDLVDASDLVVSGRVVAAEPGRVFGGDGDTDAAIRSHVLTLRVDSVLAGARGGATDEGTIVLIEEEAETVDGIPVRVDGMRAGRVGDDGIWFLAASRDPDFPGYAVVNSQGRYLAGTDGGLVGGDAADALVRRLELLGRAGLASAVRDTTR
jgi:hypothetical protein